MHHFMGVPQPNHYQGRPSTSLGIRSTNGHDKRTMYNLENLRTNANFIRNE